LFTENETNTQRLFGVPNKAGHVKDAFDRYVVADVASLPFQPQRFDGVLCFGVLQALGDSAPAIRELTAQLRPKGSLWVDALNRYCVIHAWDTIRRRLGGRGIHLLYESPVGMQAILARSGLRNVRLEWMPLVPRRWHGLQRMVETPLAKWLFNSVPLLGLVLCHAFIVRGEKPASAGQGDAGTKAPAS
jgi:SAM-dependent methyltransferase